MDAITPLRPDGLVHSPAFSHVAVVPPGATTIYVGGQNGVDESGAVRRRAREPDDDRRAPGRA